ncbi:aminotransferase class IV [Opitutales bacterium]|nr:aminotransferase class IV [Opitutales bacterium]MDA8991158.1 aminotransferase class IV [Opitutales bacterium]
MKAWNKDGKPIDHPKPWGLPGVFTTLRVMTDRKTPFCEDYLTRLRESAEKIGLPWIPTLEEIEEIMIGFLSEVDPDHGLLRICLFEDSIGYSSRPASSDGNPVEGWLLHYRRPEPTVKSTIEKNLYGTLQELDIEREDWIINDPKENDIRETATSNLIFVQNNQLLIPDKWVLNGIILQKLLPQLRDNFSITRGIPQDQEISSFTEILLCGTGRGIAPLTSLPELGWSSVSNDTFTKIRTFYEEILQTAGA